MKFKKLLEHTYKLITVISIIAAGTMPGSSFAQTKASDDNDSGPGDVTTELTPHSKDAIFSKNASYTFSVKNTYDKPETGKLSYVVLDQFNKKVLADSMNVTISRNSSDNYTFNVPPLKSSFYKINFMINVSDYDDTTRRVFGIRAEEIRSNHEKPADFEAFWDNAKKELADVKPDFKMIEKPDMETTDQKVYMIQMQSLDNMTIRGWMTIPGKFPKNAKFPVLVMLPGYQATTQPLLGPNTEMAFISVDVRGQGLNKDVYNLKREDYIINHLDDKNKYYLKGVIMDCLRYMDFVFSRPELDKSRISVTGGSMGGYMAITTAALDHRVALCAPQNPFMSDVYNMDNGAVTWPINYMKQYAKTKPGLTFDKVLENLQYFDTKNFATDVTCPFLIGIGLLDPFVPPNNSYAVFNNVPSKDKKIMVFKDLGHEVGKSYSTYEELWLRDHFAMF